GGLVLRWVTTWESPLLYVLLFVSPFLSLRLERRISWKDYPFEARPCLITERRRLAAWHDYLLSLLTAAVNT
ncbi:hypothetical protein EJ03DRAFT_283290, partial [Teratosphaeria nubilosa]